jgi:hypothetical protein
VLPTSRSLGRVGVLVCAGCWGGVLACSGGSSSPDGGPGPGGDGGRDGSHLDATAAEADSGSPEASAAGSSDAQSDADATIAADVVTGDAAETGPDDAAEPGDANGCTLGSSGEPTDLRCTGLYADWSSKAVSPDVHEYDPGLHLWSDGAVKTRWIYLPPGDAGDRQPIDTSDMDEWTFPVGTKFWKEFALGGKRVETRLLWKQGPYSWYRTTYLWSPDESSATELTTGELDADGNGYEVPDQNACLNCHGGRLDDVLGFEAVSLSSAGATPQTMQTLAAQGWITNAPDAGIVIPGNATDVAALGYLHANCGVACHNSGNGMAESTGFFMRLEVGRMGSVQATDTWQTGVGRPSYISPPGATNTLMLLAPGEAGASCVYYRMSHRTGLDEAGSGIQMPPIDTHKVDEAGVALIEGWIDQGCQ